VCAILDVGADVTWGQRVWIATLVLLWAWAMVIPDQREAAQGGLDQRTDGKVMPLQISVTGSAPASAPILDCVRLRNGQWLRVSVHHKGDGKGLRYGGERLECVYGHATSERYVQ
jgi:hypothetical protein